MAVTPTATVAKLSSHENWTNVEDVDELPALVHVHVLLLQYSVLC